MKKYSGKTGKITALLLSLAVLVSMCTMATQVSADPTKLLELDFSNFAAEQAAPSATPNPSGITATGSLAAGTGISFAERVPGTAPDYNKITKESFENSNGGTTYFIKFFDASTYPNYGSPITSWIAHTKNTYVTNAAFEDADNTISFWADATACGYDSSSPHGMWKDILCYRIDYNDGSNNVETLDLGINYDGTWNAVSAPRPFSGTNVVFEQKEGAFEVPKGWKHVVITNPKAADGKKTMNVYVNGELKKSVDLDVSGTVTHATMHFFGNSSTDDEYWKSRNDIIPEAQLGGLRVYDGIMSADDVASLYSAQLPEFSDVNGKEIVGYTLSGATVNYDGESHNIEVSAAYGATEGVDIAYTCGGEAFTGAVEPGIYDITATITKEGYLPLVLNAQLKIKKASVQPQAGDLLVDLDFSTYVKDTNVVDPDNIEGSVGGVTNNGVLSDTTVLKFKSSAMAGNWCNYQLDLESFENSQGTQTDYLHKTVGVDSCDDRNRFSTIAETGLEEQANTITFWLKYVPQTRANVQWNILDYYAVYGGTGSHLFTVEQAGTGDGECVLTGRGETPSYGGITSLIGQWVQIAVTNPEYTLNPTTNKYEKTMQIYVNGLPKGQKVVAKPEGNLEDVRIGLLGEVTHTSGKNWPQDASVSGVKVHYGEFSASEIKDNYKAERPLYSDALDNELIIFTDDEGYEIESIEDRTAVTLKYTPDTEDMALYFVACYDENGALLSVKCAKDNKDGELKVDIPDGTKIVKGYAWKADTLNPIREEIVLTEKQEVVAFELPEKKEWPEDYTFGNPGDKTVAQQRQEIQDAMDLAMNTETVWKEVPEYNPTLSQYSHIKAITYDGLEYQGGKTKIFAYVGLPSGASASSPVPAVVLVHGGGGHPFLEWIRLWNEKGYAAIAMDITGYFPTAVNAGDTETSSAFKYGLTDDFREDGYVSAPNNSYKSEYAEVSEHWAYHAISQVILAGNILRQDDRIDNNNIGIMGVSWGGVTTTQVIGYDNRFSFAIPVYGMAYLGTGMNPFGKFAQPYVDALWTAERNLDNATMPIFWFAYNDDNNFAVNQYVNSYKHSFGKNSKNVLTMLGNWGHSHGWAWSRPESYNFANWVTYGENGFPTFITHPDGREIKCKIDIPDTLTSTITPYIYYITEPMSYSKYDKFNWGVSYMYLDQEWQTTSANIRLDRETGIIRGKVPQDAKGYYIALKFKGKPTATVDSEVSSIYVPLD